jgi:gluconokinase
MPTTPSGLARDPLVLALDVGTSSVRALLFDGTGAVVDNVDVQIPYLLDTTREGAVSVDADALVEVTARAVDGALAAAGTLAGRIAAVALDTFWHSLLGVDAAGRPVTAVLTWADTRAQAAARALRSEQDEAATHARTGAVFHASYWPARLRWLAATDPQLYAQVAEWISFGEYLHRRVLGNSICSLSMASGTGLLNLRMRMWDTELMEVLGLSPRSLAPLGDLGDAIHGLREPFASRWPALRAAAWYPALGDGAAANVGSGCVTPARWALTVGTSSALRVVVPAGSVQPPAGLWLYLVDARRAILGGALSEGGNMLAWLHATLQVPPPAAAEGELAALAPDSHGLTVLPFLAGERSLGWHAEARAAVAGISLHTTPIELLRAGMEAVAYRLALVYSRMRDTVGTAAPVVASGGALLGSPTFMAIVADALGAPVYPSLEHEASARGAALLALEARGALPQGALEASVAGAPYLPQPAHTAVYARAGARQQELYNLLVGRSE